MSENWKDWDVLDKLRLIIAPQAMISASDAEAWEEEQTAIISKHWNQARELLGKDGGSGYNRLVTMRDRLAAHRDQIAPSLEMEEDKVEYLRYLKVMYFNKPRDYLDDEDDRQAFEEALYQPMGKQLLIHDDSSNPVAHSVPQMSGWGTSSSMYVGEKVPERSYDNFTVKFRPPDQDIERKGIDPDNIYPTDTPSFKSSTTWMEAVQQIHDRQLRSTERRDRFSRTDALLEFRQAVVETVLYRFEAFGEVGAPPIPSPAKYDSSLDPTWKGRQPTTTYAIDLLDAYLKHQSDVHMMKHLVECLRKEGYPEKARNRYTSIHRALKGDFEQRDPNSFVQALAYALHEANELPKRLHILLHNTSQQCDGQQV